MQGVDLISLLSPTLWLGAVALVAASFFGGYFKGRADMAASYQEEHIERLETARETERLANRAAAALKEKRDAEVRRINDRLADALERLRHRPERLPEPARAACEGATGRELAGPDAAFLERYAARAAEQEAALAECYGWIDAVRQAPR